jgi:ribose-phosphate pyrophosphokinase
MKPLVIPLQGAHACADRIATRLSTTCIRFEQRRFPDGETYLRVPDDVRDRDIVVVAHLRDPDPQLPALVFLADALHELGARSAGLVAPYLPYMRQDMRFRPGEAITSHSFARLVGGAFDWLVTVDPHLHRRASLGEILTIPTAVVPSAPAIAAWLQARVVHPFVIGPDEESRQWVSEVAALAGCPYAVFRKIRRGDRDVMLELPELRGLRGRTPVLVDDIVSTAHTLATAVRQLAQEGFDPAVCVGVHAVFAQGADELLRSAGAATVVTCNTLVHPSNAIDVTAAIAEAVTVELEELAFRAAAIPGASSLDRAQASSR